MPTSWAFRSAAAAGIVLVGSVALQNYCRRRRKALIIASRDGNLATVRALCLGSFSAIASMCGCYSILLKPEPEWAGVTAVYASALQGHADVLRYLIQQGAPVDQANHAGDMPLHIAAQEGHNACIFELLSAGAPIDWRSPVGGASALMFACQAGHDNSVDLLLRARADTDVLNHDGNSALFICCEHGHVECARWMLEAGCSTELRWGEHSRAGSGATPLFIACVTGQLGCVQLLSSYGASRHLNVPALDRLVSAEEVAEERGHHHVVEWLRSTRASPLQISARSHV